MVGFGAGSPSPVRGRGGGDPLVQRPRIRPECFPFNFPIGAGWAAAVRYRAATATTVIGCCGPVPQLHRAQQQGSSNNNKAFVAGPLLSLSPFSLSTSEQQSNRIGFSSRTVSSSDSDSRSLPACGEASERAPRCRRRAGQTDAQGRAATSGCGEGEARRDETRRGQLSNYLTTSLSRSQRPRIQR